MVVVYDLYPRAAAGVAVVAVAIVEVDDVLFELVEDEQRALVAVVSFGTVAL